MKRYAEWHARPLVILRGSPFADDFFKIKSLGLLMKRQCSPSSHRASSRCRVGAPPWRSLGRGAPRGFEPAQRQQRQQRQDRADR